MAKITVWCGAILCDNTVDLELPAGWVGESDAEDTWLFCPKHAIQEKFFGAQCSGCVEHYPDCSLVKAYGYDRSPGLTEAQLATVRSGYCPFRINGFFEVSISSGIIARNLSNKADEEASNAIADAIIAYQKEFEIPEQ